MTDEVTKAHKVVPIEWPEGGIASYANQLVAVFDGNTVYLTFCQLPPPMVIGSEAERQEQLKAIASVKALPVCRLAVSLDSLRAMVAILEEQLEKIDKKVTSDTPDVN